MDLIGTFVELADLPRRIGKIILLPTSLLNLPMVKPGKLTAQCLILVAVIFGLSESVAGWQKPNIILINLDDADSELFELHYSDVLFPNIMNVARQGLAFRNCHVTTPICGPSRACLYRGQYAHNTGIRVNDGSQIGKTIVTD